MNVNDIKNSYCKQKNSFTGACQKLAKVIENMKDRMIEEFSAKLAGHENVLRLALNEAEALAWETPYPHLVFATLAREKAQAAAKWQYHQSAVYTHSPALAGRF